MGILTSDEEKALRKRQEDAFLIENAYRAWAAAGRSMIVGRQLLALISPRLHKDIHIAIRESEQDGPMLCVFAWKEVDRKHICLALQHTADYIELGGKVFKNRFGA